MSQCRWWIFFLPCVAGSFFSSLRLQQPWHPHLERVRSGQLARKSIEEPVGPALTQASQAPVVSHCHCEKTSPGAQPQTFPLRQPEAEITGSAPGLSLMALKQAELQLEAREVGIHQEVMQLRQQIQQAEGSAELPSPQPALNPPWIPTQAAPPQIMSGWQWVPNYAQYMPGPYGAWR